VPSCPACNADVLDIDVKCASCGTPLGTTGAHRLIGNIVFGQYEIIDVLGQGGMSVVYKARHKITAQDVALKLLPPELAAHSQVKGRFLEEAKALAQLDHANIVHLYNFGEENGAFVLAMQFVQGQTWERIILTSGRQDWPTACRISIDVLRALEYAHGRGIVHRDMKPSNVLVRESDGAATVMDFGIAKMTTSSRLTATGQTMGTVRYMSPEQVRGQEVDVRTDLYSLGATLYEALCGDTPFDGNTHFEIMTKHLHEPPRPPSVLGIELPPALETAVLRSLAKKPEDRFQTARDFRKALEAVLKDADVGLAETQRVARDSVPAPLSGRVPPGPTAPMGRGGAAAAAAPPPEKKAAPITGIADRLEPGDSLSASEPMVTPRRRTGLWLGLGLMVAAGAATVAVLMIKRNDAPARATNKPAPDAKPAPPELKPFLPPDLPIIATEVSPDSSLTVHVSNDWAPSEVSHVWTTVKDRYTRFVTEQGGAMKVPSPVIIVIVPARVLCDRRIYEEGVEVAANCKDLGSYYRPLEHTLLVVDDRANLDRNLGVGLASANCIHDETEKACALIDPFEEMLKRGS
jgi:serine/threonine protein kinase